MRPRTLDDIIGQDHIVGPGRLLRRAIQADRLSSLIFYGPPGTGKTSLARVIANTTRSVFESLNAVLSGVKDIREGIDRADERRRLYGKRTILFVDEVHRWNKAQQDALLPWVENGTVILIGATTENPFFEVNKALVSRSRIFQLKSLEAPDLMKAARKALEDSERGYGKWKAAFEEGALEHLVEVAGGDARSLLNALELAVETSGWSLPDGEAVPGGASWPPPEGAGIRVSFETAEESIQRRAVLYDKDGDYHFDTISAFIKSVRGSDPDAALYWMAKMVRAGESPAFIFRRMIILAMEDVGLADPGAIQAVIACAEAFDRIGFPEGNFALAEACLYLATAPKSNTAMAFFDALAEVDKEEAEVPNHLRDASRDAEGFGHGEGYIYPHAYRDHWAAQQYLPSSLKGKTFYTPSSVGYESRIRDEVLRKREIQAAVIMGDAHSDTHSDTHGSGTSGPPSEILTWSASSKGRAGWFKRLESGRSALLLSDRDRILGSCVIARHDRILIPAANDGLLLWESLRRVPEGLAAALVDTETAREALLRFSPVLDETEEPRIAVTSGILPAPAEAEEFFGSPVFDHILSREPWRRGFRSQSVPEAFGSFAGAARKLLAPGGDLVLLYSPPLLGERISRILKIETALPADMIEYFKEAESIFFRGEIPKELVPAKHGTGGEGNAPWIWDGEDLRSVLEGNGFTVKTTVLEQSEERLLGSRDLESWFNREKSSWGSFMVQHIGESKLQQVRDAMEERIRQGPLVWKWQSLLTKASFDT
jgi:putative ATPase